MGNETINSEDTLLPPEDPQIPAKHKGFPKPKRLVPFFFHPNDDLPILEPSTSGSPGRSGDLLSQRKGSFIKTKIQSRRGSLANKDSFSSLGSATYKSSASKSKSPLVKEHDVAYESEEQATDTEAKARPRLFGMRLHRKKAQPIVEACEATATTKPAQGTVIENNIFLKRSHSVGSLKILPSAATSTFSLQTSLSSDSIQAGAHGKGWDRVYALLSGLMGKTKKEPADSREKKLRPERLELTRQRIADALHHQMHTENHLRAYAPLFTLRLVAILFSDEAARVRLEKQSCICWGLRRVTFCGYIEADAVWDSQKGPRTTGQSMPAAKYVARVTKECWKSIMKLGRGKGVDAQKELWFLRQFCILYGFGVTKLKILTSHMLPQLLAIAALKELDHLLPYNEDTVYALEKPHRPPPCLHLRRSNIRRNISGSILKHRRNRATTFLSSPLAIHIYEDNSKVTLEHVIFILMETFTRCKAPFLPLDVFGQLVVNLPCGLSVADSSLRDELHICVDYLLTCESVIAPCRWFREGCDLRQLELLNQRGLEACYQPKMDPRLVAAHLKYVILSQGGLISLDIARAIMAIFPIGLYLDDPALWRADQELIQTLEALLSIPLFQFKLLQKVISIAQRIIVDPASAHDLAIVLSVIPAHLFQNVLELKHWCVVWGDILKHSHLLFCSPDLQSHVLPPPRVKSGYLYALDILNASGIKFLK